jgi:hypothetical protein
MTVHVCIRRRGPADNIGRFNCLDCGENTARLDEYYMVRGEVWRFAVPVGRGMLCIGCLEHRIGRKLRPRDFTPARVNLPWSPDVGPKSPRLMDRLGITL